MNYSLYQPQTQEVFFLPFLRRDARLRVSSTRAPLYGPARWKIGKNCRKKCYLERLSATISRYVSFIEQIYCCDLLLAFFLYLMSMVKFSKPLNTKGIWHAKVSSKMLKSPHPHSYFIRYWFINIIDWKIPIKVIPSSNNFELRATLIPSPAVI